MVCGGCGAHCLCWLDKQLFAQFNNCLDAAPNKVVPVKAAGEVGGRRFLG
jgi:hypothetical protein